MQLPQEVAFTILMESSHNITNYKQQPIARQSLPSSIVSLQSLVSLPALFRIFSITSMD
jgi:hypothetical protein